MHCKNNISLILISLLSNTVFGMNNKNFQEYVVTFLPMEFRWECRPGTSKVNCLELFKRFDPLLNIDDNTRKKEVAKYTLAILKEKRNTFHPIAQEAIVKRTLEGLDKSLKNQPITHNVITDEEIAKHIQEQIYPLLPDDLRGASQKDRQVKTDSDKSYPKIAKALYCSDPSKKDLTRDVICEGLPYSANTWMQIVEDASVRISKDKGFYSRTNTNNELAQEVKQNFKNYTTQHYKDVTN